MLRNGWPESSAIPGRNVAKRPAGLVRNTHLEGELICARHRIKALESERKQILEVDGPKTLRVSFDSRAVDPLKLAAKKERLVSIIK